MGFVFLLVRIALGGFFAWRGVRYLDPYARQEAIASARAKGSSGSDLAFVTMGLMMLSGGMCIVMGITPGVGVIAAVTALAIHAFYSVRSGDGRRAGYARTAGLAAVSALMLLVPRPWPFSFVA
jgi:uncharacterized membrane protein YphA (DoxX/SURF4 family)